MQSDLQSQVAPGLKLAMAQIDVTFGQIETNTHQIAKFLRQAASQGANLVVFPECSLCGYSPEDQQELRQIAQSSDSPHLAELVALCQKLQIFAVLGYLEQNGDSVFNAAMLAGPGGIQGIYRKSHLPFIGADRFCTPGSADWTLFDVLGVRVGLLICYDIAFPEPARCLALLGADLILLPTNWAEGTEPIPNHAINTRAMENTIYCASANRVGTERGTTFNGLSRICDPLGNTLAQAEASETILYAQIDSLRARQKHLIRKKGLAEINRLADRRPELYSLITQPSPLPRPNSP